MNRTSGERRRRVFAQQIKSEAWITGRFQLSGLEAPIARRRRPFFHAARVHHPRAEAAMIIICLPDGLMLSLSWQAREFSPLLTGLLLAHTSSAPQSIFRNTPRARAEKRKRKVAHTRRVSELGLQLCQQLRATQIGQIPRRRVLAICELIFFLQPQSTSFSSKCP